MFGTPSIDRIVLAPRWSGTLESDFYPWLQSELREQYPSVRVEEAELRPPSAPDLVATTNTVVEALADATKRPHTIAMGHSVGCQAVLRALASGQIDSPVAGTLLVAGWWTVDAPWPTIRPWIDTAFEQTRARVNAGRIIVLLSDNDPFTADAQASAREFTERLGAEIRLVPGAKHFNGSMEPSVLSALCDLLTP